MFHRKIDWSSRLVAALVFLPAFLLALAIFHPALVVEGQAQAPAAFTADRDWPEKCSLETLEGRYAWFEQGTVVKPIPAFPFPPPFPYASVGIATYDGEGNSSGHGMTNLNGVPVPGTFTGTYVVNADCTLTGQFTNSRGMVLKYAGIITGLGMFQEIHYIYTDAFSFAVGSERKTPRRGCSQETFAGTYVVFGQGKNTLAPLPGFPPPPYPMGHVATVTADGAGNLSGQGIENVDGVAFPATFTATYTVSLDCMVSATIADTALGTTMTLPEVFTITGEGPFQEMHGVLSGPGAVFVDTLKRQ